MAKQKLLIDWPLTPFTGWGSYGIQLAQALLAKGIANPVLTSYADRSPHCEVQWLLRLTEIEKLSEGLINHISSNSNALVTTNCQVVMEPIGNLVPSQRIKGNHQVGVTFFERSNVDKQYLASLNRFDLIVTGSRWNQRVLEEAKCQNAVLVHQGIDTSRFNPIPVPRLMNRPFVIFAGGKLEARKGQDIVISAFREFIKQCPDALLIACWGNLGNVGLETISLSSYVCNAPREGDAVQIHNWLIEQEIPVNNQLIPQIVANSQLPGLIKQADTAVFTSRCEGGTNLMAMETLACGIPTVLSANTGHLDLLELNLEHLIPIGGEGIGKVPKPITEGYGGDEGALWGETNPSELVEVWSRLLSEKEVWREKGMKEACRMAEFSWELSMKKLIGNMIKNNLLRDN